MKFHDGSRSMPKAPSTSINRTLNEQLDCEIRIKFFGGMKVTPKAVDSYTLDVKTAEPAPILPTMMGTMTVSVAQHGHGRAHPRAGRHRALQVRRAGRPAPAWCSTASTATGARQPEVEKATYVWRAESAVRAAMVATGEADIAPTIAVQDATDPAMDFTYFNSETTQLPDRRHASRRSTTSASARRSTSPSTARP